MLQRLLFLLVTANLISYFWIDYHAAQSLGEQKARRQQYQMMQNQAAHEPLYLTAEKPQAAINKNANNTKANKAKQCFSIAFAAELSVANATSQIAQHESVLREIESLLKDQGVGVQLHSQTAQVLQGYLIYLPPAINAARAKSTIEELKQQGIDAFMFATGELANGISLGLYSQRDGAEAAVERFVRLGYSAELKHRYKLMRWPYLAIGELQKNGEGAAHNLEQVLRKITGNYSGLLIASKPCAGVAHEAELE